MIYPTVSDSLVDCKLIIHQKLTYCTISHPRPHLDADKMPIFDMCPKKPSSQPYYCCAKGFIAYATQHWTWDTVCQRKLQLQRELIGGWKPVIQFAFRETDHRSRVSLPKAVLNNSRGYELFCSGERRMAYLWYGMTKNTCMLNVSLI